MPDPGLEVYPIPAFGGGINDNAALFGGMREDESIELVNAILDGRGKLSFRRGCEIKDTLVDESGAEVKAVLGIWAWGTGTLAVSWQDDATDGLAIDGTIALSAVAAEKFKTTTTAYYYISETQYTKTATDSLTFSAAHEVTATKWGVIALQINAAGTVSTKVPASPQAYESEALAIAALPSADASNVLLGYITINADAGTWTANTDDMTDGSDLTEANFYDYYETVNSIDIHTSSAQDGSGFSYVCQLYANITSVPDLQAQEITAGGGGTGTPDSTWPAGQRMYFCTSDGSNELKFFANTDSTVYTVQRILPTGGSLVPIYPRTIAEFNYHLFAGGYQDPNYSGPEVVRYSTPGLVAIDDDSTGEGGGTDTFEWHQDGYEAVGRPGEPINWMKKVGGGLVIGKENNIHRWWGYGAATWGQVHVNGQFGAINNQAVVADKHVYYMSPFGPCRTDGHQVQFIGDQVQQFINNVESLDEVVIVHDPTKFQVLFFFIDSSISSSYPSIGKAYSYLADAWTDVEYFQSNSTTGHMLINSGGVVGTVTVPGPATGPSSLAIVVTTNTWKWCRHQLSLSWINGDNNPTTYTEIWRIKSETAPTGTDWTDGTATLIYTVGSGVSSYIDTITEDGTTWGDKYWYQIRHLRNGQYSNWNNNNADPLATDVSTTLGAEPSAPTAPSGLAASNASWCNVATPMFYEDLTWTNNHSGHANEEYCEYEVYGYHYTDEEWSLRATGTTWNGLTTDATSSITVFNPADGDGIPVYSQWKVRIKDTHQSCGSSYQYSSYSSTASRSITVDPCTGFAIPE